MADISNRTNPFPGLRPFELDEEHLFFGREGQADELLTRLNRTRFLAVVGTSGSGKSSLVRAGLLPSLYSGFLQDASSGWRVALLRPGSAPIGNLAAALNQPDVFGVDPCSDEAIIRSALTESTLRRGSLGLIEVPSRPAWPSTRVCWWSSISLRSCFGSRLRLRDRLAVWRRRMKQRPL